MIRNDTAKSRINTNIPPSMICRIEFEEICSVCDKEVPDGKVVMRHSESKHIICMSCVEDLLKHNGA